MKKYKIEVSRTAEKQLKKLSKPNQIRIVKRIQQLSIDPFPEGSRKLAGFDDIYRVRVGDYRVLYSVDNGKVLIIVLKLGHRKDIYRRL